VIRSFKGRTPLVAGGSYVDESAQVIGDVEIGAESSVWMNVVIRGDVNRIRIGKRTNIQDLTMIHVMRDTHPTIIGDEVTSGTPRWSTARRSTIGCWWAWRPCC